MKLFLESQSECDAASNVSNHTRKKENDKEVSMAALAKSSSQCFLGIENYP